MFLLTFVLIIISVLGVYTQVYALDAARSLAKQTSFASIVLNWHTTAAGVAANAMQPTGAGTSCSLTPSDAASSQCLKGPNVTSANSKAITTGTYTNPAGITVSPPSGLVGGIYQWNSIAFTPAAGGGYYVLTYVKPPTGTNTNISTATSPAPTQLNVTLSDLYRQLRLLGIPTYSFGYVSAANTLNVAPIMINSVLTPISYPLPAGVIPPGSLAIISSPGQCSSC